MGTKGYASTLIIIALVLTPFVAIIDDWFPFWTIAMWVFVIYKATQSATIVQNSAYELRKYMQDPDSYQMPDFLFRGIGGPLARFYKPKTDIAQISFQYKQDAFVSMAWLQCCYTDLAKISAYMAKARVDILTNGVYKVDLYGIYRYPSAEVGEISVADSRDYYKKRKTHIYVTETWFLPGDVMYTHEEACEHRYWSSFINHYHMYEYNREKGKIVEIIKREDRETYSIDARYNKVREEVENARKAGR